jgi:hypothetical protein
MEGVTEEVEKRQKRGSASVCLEIENRLGGNHLFRLDQRMEKRKKGRLQSWALGKGWPRTPKSFTRARQALPFYALWAGHPWNGLTAVSGVVHPQGRRLAAVFHPHGHPKSCVYGIQFTAQTTKCC